MTNYGSNASRTAFIILPVHKWKTEGNHERATGLISTGEEHFEAYKFLLEVDKGANAVSYLNRINASNVSKLYIIRQFITYKLQWYHDTNHSLQTWCIIALKNSPVTWCHVWMFLCTSSKMCINPKVRLGLGFGFIDVFGAFKGQRNNREGLYLNCRQIHKVYGLEPSVHCWHSDSRTSMCLVFWL